MILLLAVDNNWNIGYKGDMLIKIPEDLKRFRMMTTGNIIIMGRKSFDALPDKKALPERINIVITRDREFSKENVITVNSIEELFGVLKKINPDNKMINYVIGGGNIGHQLLPYCNKAYITKIYKAFEKADTSLPNLDLDPHWEIEKESEIFEYNDIEYKYVNYNRIT